jgi:hypothetical protein
MRYLPGVGIQLDGLSQAKRRRMVRALIRLERVDFSNPDVEILRRRLRIPDGMPAREQDVLRRPNPSHNAEPRSGGDSVDGVVEPS